jgi:3-dehydroquinate synthetase
MLSIIPNKFKKIQISYDLMMNSVLNDKKNDGDNVCFILLDEIGKSVFLYKEKEEVEENLKKILKELFINFK